MSELKIYPDRVVGNIEKLNRFCNQKNRRWSLVTKVLSGHKPTLERILSSDSISELHSVGDSRVSSLKSIKSINSEVETMYLKPPAKSYLKNVVRHADISLNTDYITIKALNEEAKRQGKKHKVLIMIEMGELREGVVRGRFLEFYSKVFEFENIEILGLGTNLGCMYGIEPTFDKLIQLCLYKQLIDVKYDVNLELVSGGSSITLPLLSKDKVPAGVNHLRVGEAAFFGVSPLDGKRFSKLSTNAFEFAGDIIELERKSDQPDGVMGEASIGETSSIQNGCLNSSFRAIVDFGIIDVDAKNLRPKDKQVDFSGTTSDVTVYDVGMNLKGYKTGDHLLFNPNYMAVARLMNSKFVSKSVV